MTSDLKIALVSPANEPDLRKLLRDTPVSGDIRLALEREPNALEAAAVSGDEYQLFLGYADSGRTVLGAGARFELDAYINGRPQRIGYLGELRVAGGLRQRRNMLLEGYKALRRQHEAGSAPFYLTTIIATNTAARRLLEAGLGDMPAYRPLETMITFTIPARRGARGRFRSSSRPTAATEDQLPDIVARLAEHGREFQFYPVWTESTMRSEKRCRALSAQDFVVCRTGDRLAGCLALWDQRSFKQTVITGYAEGLNRLRPVFNLCAPLLGRPRLPSPGSRLESAFLSHVACEADDGDTMEAMIRHACRQALERGLDYVMTAFAETHPLTAVIRDRFPCHSYASIVYVVYWEDGRVLAESLDGRVTHPEVAIL